MRNIRINIKSVLRDIHILTHPLSLSSKRGMTEIPLLFIREGVRG